MFRKAVIMTVFAFAVGLVGCRSCWGPYDRCQPTFVPEAGDQCMGELYRNGSILGGMERRNGETGCATCGGGNTADFAAESNAVSQVNHEEYMTNGTMAPAGAPSSVPAASAVGNAVQSFHDGAEELPPRAITQRPIQGGAPANEPLPTGEFLPPDPGLQVESFPLAE